MVGNSAYRLQDLSYSMILKNNMELSKTVKEKDFTINIFSNIIVNPIKEILEFYIRSISLNPLIKFGNYDNIVQDTFAVAETDLVIVFYELINLTENFHLQAELLSEAEVSEVIEKCKRDIDLIFDNLAGRLVLFNKFSSFPFTGSHISKRNLEIIAIELNAYVDRKKPTNVQLVDINRILSSIGADGAYDRKKFLKYKSLYKIDFLKLYIAAIENILLRVTGKLKKALIFDCDNTLWKGVIGEDGPDGIDMSPKSEIGINYFLVQKIAANLSGKGILICLCSKNNPAEVEGLLSSHPDMVLNNDHIVAMKVNWNTKDDNLKSLAEELNIGLDSFVFIDDSEFEVNLIKANVPQVLTIAVPKDVHEYPAMIMEIAQRYFNLEPLNEDLKKIKIYKEQAKRVDAMKTVGDIDSYLATLETKVNISKNNAHQISRIAQLTQKTNQFNFTTKRYSEFQIAAFMNDPGSCVFSIDVADKFGESGITGVIILKELSTEVIEIDSYLLSCRILGRKIEVFFLNYIIDYCKHHNYKFIRASYIKTNKNSQVRDFYKENHFIEEKISDEMSTYTVHLQEYQQTQIGFITLIEPSIKS